jgi:hypothetical protein
MNKFLFLNFKKTREFIIALIALSASFSHAQTSDTPHANQSQVLTQKELDAINNAPIAPKVYAKPNAVHGRDPNFEYESLNGTQIKEYRDIGQNTDIRVDSSMGTSYQLKPTDDKDAVASPQTINRVPSIQLPF